MAALPHSGGRSSTWNVFAGAPRIRVAAPTSSAIGIELCSSELYSSLTTFSSRYRSAAMSNEERGPPPGVRVNSIEESVSRSLMIQFQFQVPVRSVLAAILYIDVSI